MFFVTIHLTASVGDGHGLDWPIFCGVTDTFYAFQVCIIFVQTGSM